MDRCKLPIVGYEESDGDKGYYLEYEKIEGGRGEVVLFGGFRTDMNSTKAMALREYCMKNDLGFTRFSYLGHGESYFGNDDIIEDFKKCGLGVWKQNCLDIIEKVIKKEVVIVGSSMGGWLMLLTALAIPNKVKGLIGIAPAPDFFKEKVITDEYYNILSEKGVCYPFADESLPVTQYMLENTAPCYLLGDSIDIKCPIRILQGSEDDIVDADMPYRIESRVTSEDVSVEIVNGSDHRMNDELALKKMFQNIEYMFSV